MPLEDLPLTKNVSSWAHDILATMKAVDAGTANPDKVRFACLEGPAGTGKGTLAAALARSAGWSFVSTSVGEWLDSSDGHLGGVTKSAKVFFDALSTAEGGVVGFIDEIDCLPNRAAMDRRDSQWWTPVVTSVLIKIDTLRQSDRPVLLLGATNHYQKLDAALIRPRRLETRVRVLPPNEEERRAIFQRYLGERLDEHTLGIAARLAVEATPARIESWSLAAISAAEAEHRALSPKDLIELIAPQGAREPVIDRTICIHEAGHAVVALEMGLPILEISVLPSGGSAGWVKTRHDDMLLTRQDVECIGATLLGGRAADIVLGVGPHAGAQNDLEAVNRLVRDAMVSHGLYGSIQTSATADAADWGQQGTSLSRAIADELDRLLGVAIAVVKKRRHDVLRLADVLERERVMNGERAMELLPDRLGRHRPPTILTPPEGI